MKRRLLLILAITVFAHASISAEEKVVEEKKISYNVAMDFGSTYLWRAFDYYEGHMPADSRNSVFNFAPALFPSITATMSNGLWFNLWANVAMIDREATGANLQVLDSLAFTGAYTVTEKSGTFGALFSGYFFPVAGETGAYPSYAEMIFSYTAPVILNPTTTAVATLGPTGGEYEYVSLQISHEFKAGIVKFAPKLIAGYWIFNNDPSANKLHVDLNLPLTFVVTDSFEFHVMLTGCYRPIGWNTEYSPFMLVASLGTSYSF